ncbi:unnamed protein product [Protopolystoma xenopodis]|uniref:Uncharacterized protein n=1 Tax=Protopolystoma xenopodis TaxID=117903 RepID=A0A3S4ZRS4_9PLAT|nr:unnamed protein product [Protopolystoma xenopodis]
MQLDVLGFTLVSDNEPDTVYAAGWFRGRLRINRARLPNFDGNFDADARVLTTSAGQGYVNGNLPNKSQCHICRLCSLSLGICSSPSKIAMVAEPFLHL